MNWGYNVVKLVNENIKVKQVLSFYDLPSFSA